MGVPLVRHIAVENDTEAIRLRFRILTGTKAAILVGIFEKVGVDRS